MWLLAGDAVERGELVLRSGKVGSGGGGNLVGSRGWVSTGLKKIGRSLTHV